MTIGASRVVVLRRLEDGRQIPIQVDLYRAVRHPEERITIRPGDYVVLEYTRVESPVRGIASRSLRSEGTLVSGSEVLLTTVTQVDPIWVNFGIPDDERLRLQREADAGRLVLPKDGGFHVTVRLADGSIYARSGRLAFADIRVSGQTGTSEARAELPNPEGRLRPGQFVRVTLSGATRPYAVLVPQPAVLEGRRASSSTSRTRRAPPRRARSSSASGPAATVY